MGWRNSRLWKATRRAWFPSHKYPMGGFEVFCVDNRDVAEEPHIGIKFYDPQGDQLEAYLLDLFSARLLIKNLNQAMELAGQVHPTADKAEGTVA